MSHQHQLRVAAIVFSRTVSDKWCYVCLVGKVTFNENDLLQ